MMRNFIYKVIVISISFGMYLVEANFLYAEVYKWVDENGKSHYTDSPSKIPRQYRENNTVKTLVADDEGGSGNSVNGKLKPVSRASKGKYKKAEHTYTQLIKADPGNPRGYIRRGHVRNLMGKTQAGTKDLNKGLKLVQAVIHRHPNDCTAYQMMAEAYRYMKKYDNSITAIQKAIRISPQRKNYRMDLQAIRLEKKKANL